MSNKKSKLLEFIKEYSPVCDLCLSEKMGYAKQQDVNGICNELSKDNIIIRTSNKCGICGNENRKVNCLNSNQIILSATSVKKTKNTLDESLKTESGIFKYREKKPHQLKQNYNSRKIKKLNGFDSFDDFHNWYFKEDKQHCFYCGILEEEVQKIVITGLLKSKRFPQNEINGQGTSRGMWLEVDRKDPTGSYSRENCVLACYFCNNDKSDVFGAQQYLNFFQNRAEFLRNLLNE